MSKIMCSSLYNKSFHVTVGESVVVSSLDKLTGGPNSSLSRLAGARMGVFHEPAKSMKINIETLKRIAGGDSIEFRDLYEKSRETKMNAKVLLCTNHPPMFDGDSESAFIDRLRFIPFFQTYTSDPNPELGQLKSDPNLIEELETKYLNSFFTWVADGAKLWYEVRLSKDVPAALKETMKAYLETNQPLRAFVQDMLVKDANAKISATELYRLYGQWAYSMNMENISQKEFGTRIKNIIPDKRMKTGMMYLGYKAKPDEPAIDPSIDAADFSGLHAKK